MVKGFLFVEPNSTFQGHSELRRPFFGIYPTIPLPFPFRPQTPDFHNLRGLFQFCPYSPQPRPEFLPLELPSFNGLYPSK